MSSFNYLAISLKNLNIVVTTYAIVAVVFIIVVLIVVKKRKLKNFKKELTRLDKEKNEIESAPILSELNKVETIIKNDKMEEKYKSWQEKFEQVKTHQISKITDMIIDLDIFLDRKDYKSYNEKLAKVEIELYKARGTTNKILEEINEVNLSEEKYRKIITKLKSKYRELEKEFEENIDHYEEIAETIELRFENIEKRFQDFEEYMENNDYSEVFHIVKAIDTLIDHIGIVVKEVPDLVLLANKLIPKKIEQITEIYEDMKSKDYPLEYLNVDYNIEEALKNVNKIIDRIKVLNLEDCMFELRTLLEYSETLFNEFESEKKNRKVYEESNEAFSKKLEGINYIVDNVYNQLDDIKGMYDLKDQDIKEIDNIRERLNAIKKQYKDMLKEIKKKQCPYSKALIVIEELSTTLKELEENLDTSLKSLGNMHDDEERAREQLDEIQELLKQSKVRIRSYKLPIISNNYFTELSEANEAIIEIIKELEKKPISIKVLNTRVDTARDLVLKLYTTTNDMIKTAKLAESSIVYGNRYRNEDINIETGLNNAEQLFFKGNYKKALEVAVGTIERIDPEINVKINSSLDKS